MVGYPYGGSGFIVLMIPYMMFMVFKANAIFLPALILHCASETSIVTVVCFSFIVLSILKYRVLVQLKLARLFWILLGLLPVFMLLTWQRISVIGDYPPVAFSYIGYYLSFFSFFYGVFVANTFSKQILFTIYYTLFVVFILFFVGVIDSNKLIPAFYYLFISSFAFLLHFPKKNSVILIISLFALGFILFNSQQSSFTKLSGSLFSFLLAYLYFKNKTKLVLKMTGIIPFLIIFFYQSRSSTYVF